MTSTEYDPGWAPGSVWTLQRKEKSPTKIRIPYYRTYATEATSLNKTPINHESMCPVNLSDMIPRYSVPCIIFSITRFEGETVRFTPPTPPSHPTSIIQHVQPGRGVSIPTTPHLAASRHILTTAGSQDVLYRRFEIPGPQQSRKISTHLWDIRIHFTNS
jgi:hypothetical protein